MEKTILCFGDSNTWGWIPGTDGERFDSNTRWTRLLAKKLGAGYNVVEMGQNGRTTVLDDPVELEKNGYKQILPAMDCASPLDTVIIMLGTNDCKERFGGNGFSIAISIGRVACKAKQTQLGVNGASPRVIIVNPAYIRDTYLLDDVTRPAFGDGAAERSRDIGKYLPAIAAKWNCDYMDANEYVHTSDIEGVHLPADQHALLAEAIYQKLISL